MPRRFAASSPRVVLALALGCAMGFAQAVELGEVAVRSWLGQPLVADIELTGFSSGTGAVGVKLARPEIFEGANIAVHPVLPGVRMSVMQRDGRQFLHLTSIAPVKTPYVHMFLELTDGSGRHLRAATLSLSPDPTPAPAPVALPIPIPAPVPKPAAPTPKPAALAPKPAAPAPEPAAPAVKKPAPVAVVLPAPRTVPVKLPAPAAVAACPKPANAPEQVRACAASEYRSALLSAQIVELEEKVKLLQAALETPLPPPPPARPVRVAARIAPVAVTPAATPDGGGMPWMWIGCVIGVLSAIGGGVAWRRRAVAQPTPAPQPPRQTGTLIARLRDALQRDKRPGSGPPAGAETPQT